MKKTDLVIILIAVFLIVGGAWYYSQPKVTLEPETETTTSPKIEEKPTEKAASPPQTQEEDLVMIFKNLFAAKFDHSTEETNIGINQKEKAHVSGTVSFAGEMGGGWFLGAKINNKWVIVDDGNGTVSCEKIAPFDFPTDMVPECWKESTGKLITR